MLIRCMSYKVYIIRYKKHLVNITTYFTEFLHFMIQGVLNLMRFKSIEKGIEILLTSAHHLNSD